MKKILFVTALVMFVLAGRVSAQKEIVVWHGINSIVFAVPNGPQTLAVPGGRGTLKFDKNGDIFTNVVFVEATTLKNHRALLVSKFEKAVPQVPCNNPLPNGCFQSADKSFAMCVCKPNDLTSETYTIALLLPAVQAARGAAN